MQTLKEVRTERLLSVRDLAERAGVAASTVHDVETGKRVPSFRVIRALSAALGVEPADVTEFAEAIAAKKGETAATRTPRRSSTPRAGHKQSAKESES